MNVHGTHSFLVTYFLRIELLFSTIVHFDKSKANKSVPVLEFADSRLRLGVMNVLTVINDSNISENRKNTLLIK